MNENTIQTVTLDTPIKRGDESISTIVVRKPGAGELRGLSLVDLIRMEVAALHVVLPRITTPTLTTADVSKLDPADLMQLGTKVSSFLLTRSAKEEDSLQESKTPSQTLQ